MDRLEAPRHLTLKVQPNDSQRSPAGFAPCPAQPRDQPASVVPKGCQLRVHSKKASLQKLLISPTWVGLLIPSFNIRVLYDFLIELSQMEIY